MPRSTLHSSIYFHTHTLSLPLSLIQAIEVVFKLESGLTAEALKRVCEVDEIIRTQDLGDGAPFDPMNRLPSLSVGAIFAHFQGEVCSQLTTDMVTNGIAILETCAPFYHARG